MAFNSRLFANSAKNAFKSFCFIRYRHNLNVNAFRYAQTNAVKCWKCGVEKKSLFELFCDQCNVIQDPHQQKNYFKILNVNESYDLNRKELQNKYRELQSVLHPDKFSTR